MITTVSFFGHRNVAETEELKLQVERLIESLICEKGAREFLFGSRSNFDSICYNAVSNLKEKYPHIRRIAYCCKSETAATIEEHESLQKALDALHLNVQLDVFDEERGFKTKYVAGRASYVERNYAMIDDSDVCVFYYNKDYLPPKRKHSKRDVFNYQPKSGTKLALDYAKRKNKTVFILGKTDN